MTCIRAAGFTLSLDRYGAGPDQDINSPLSIDGTELHQWLVATRTFQRTLFSKDGGTTGAGDDFTTRSFRSVGAWVLGRNMSGPIRRDWPGDTRKGWWDNSPSYHVPVFVLTHYARAPIEMAGGTASRSITGSFRKALERAREAAGGKDIRIGGGSGAIRQYLREGLVDELHITISSVLLGCEESLFGGIDLRALGYACIESAASEKATHVVLRRPSPMNT